MRNIDFKKLDFVKLTKSEFLEGKIENDLFTQWETPEFIKSLSVVVVLKTALNLFENAKKDAEDENDNISGVFFIPLIVNREGYLMHRLTEKKYPWIPRNYLMPIEEQPYVLGDLIEYEEFLSQHNIDSYDNLNWEEFIEYLQDMFKKITKGDVWSNHLMDMNGYKIEFDDNLYIFKEDFINATDSIEKLYVSILKSEVKLPLYETFVNNAILPSKPLHKGKNTDIKHYGQMGGLFGLSDSQRLSLAQFNEMKNGEVLAIKGPPGTGKTTLLQSIVANQLVSHALEQKDAPVIIATSTNNQAVTNIIDSFGKIEKSRNDNLENRWITGVNSFALYHPSKIKIENAMKKGYQVHYPIEADFGLHMDEEKNIVSAKEKMIESTNTWFHTNISTIKECKNKIFNILNLIDERKTAIYENVYEVLEILNEQTYADYMEDVYRQVQMIDKTLIDQQERVHCLKDVIMEVQERIEQWNAFYSSIPWLKRFLKFFPPFKQNIKRKISMFKKVEEMEFLGQKYTIEEILECYAKQSEFLKKECFEEQQIITTLENDKIIQNHKIQVVQGYIEAIRTDVFHLYKKGVIEKRELELFTNVLNNFDKQEFDLLIDRTIRYVEFWLAIHYYECRWIEGEHHVTDKQRSCNFKNVIECILRRNAMIAPCNVATCYRLPSLFQIYDVNEKYQRHLMNFADLLIIDEAGQVSPEIAAGCFALAKKAVVVGDEKQIPPIWNITRQLDITLSLKYGLITDSAAFIELEKTGLNCSSSSVMRIASNATNYDMHGKGLLLVEHRRCYDEIISYCNKLVYKDALKPLRGSGVLDSAYRFKNLPHMGHYDTNIEKSDVEGSSRFNREEAKQIVRWLKDNFDNIAKAYENEPKGSIGIITPFTKQVQILRHEIKKLSSELSALIEIGTVHTFQGAEKKIIIFSSVYGYEESCGFINRNTNLMNVAVSRAKDAFLVFGSYQTLTRNKHSAGGLLADMCSMKVPDNIIYKEREIL